MEYIGGTINIVDFQYLYYKYKNLCDIGRLRTLSYEGKDTTMLYYTIKEIEKFSNGGKIPTCVCFDSKAQKRENSDTYKKNRKSTLGDSDFQKIAEIKDILAKAGYEVYKEAGYEADDLIAKLADKLYNYYDNIEIYSVDKDLLQLVNRKVAVNLFRARRDYMRVTLDNFCLTTEELFKTYIPINFVKLFKCMCGDASDNISGIKGFGPKSFEKWLKLVTLDAEQCNDCAYLTELLRSSLSDEAYEQAVESLALVEFRHDFDLDMPFKDGVKRNSGIYREYGMNSLVK